MPAAEADVTRWFESKSSDTGEGAVKSVNLVSNSRGNIWDLKSEEPGEVPNETSAWGDPRGPGGSEQPQALLSTFVLVQNIWLNSMNMV